MDTSGSFPDGRLAASDQAPKVTLMDTDDCALLKSWEVNRMQDWLENDNQLRFAPSTRFTIVGRLRDDHSRKIYILEHADLKQKLALKLWPTLEDVNYTEIKVHYLLSNYSGFVKFYGTYQIAFDNDDTIYCGLLMECVEGSTLFAEVLAKPFTSEECNYYAAQLFQIQWNLWQLNVHHRDIKPGNLMIDSEGHLRLIDFGASAIHGGKTEFFGAWGTTKYWAPELSILLEQSDKDKAFDDIWKLLNDMERSVLDSWPIGLICYFMLDGKLPFLVSDNGCDYPRANREPLRDPSRLVDPQLWELIKQCLEVDRAKRFWVGKAGESEFLKFVATYSMFDRTKSGPRKPSANILEKEHYSTYVTITSRIADDKREWYLH